MPLAFSMCRYHIGTFNIKIEFWPLPPPPPPLQVMVEGRISLEKASLFIFTCLSCGGACRRRKIGGFNIPLAAASQIVISMRQTAHN
jgi:hypothetical protein